LAKIKWKTILYTKHCCCQKTNSIDQILHDISSFIRKTVTSLYLSPFGGLATYAVHLRLIGKLLVDFLLVIIELFSLGVRPYD